MINVTTTIPIKSPPTMIDLLLPPVIKPKSITDLLSPFTWPSLAGATACRIMHYYKRLRNEVDDGLREFRDLKSLSISQRRQREKIAPLRIFSECISTHEEMFQV